MTLNRRPSPSRAVLVLAALALTLPAVGCIVEVEDDVVYDRFYLADLEVRWSINGSDDPAWCDDLGIESWLVEVQGREDTEVELSCRGDYWDTGSALHGLAEGDYRVVVRALDFDGFEITSSGARLGDLVQDGSVDVLTVRFTDLDF